MSLENNIGRMAEALEAQAKALQQIAEALASGNTAQAPVTAPAPEAPAQQQPPAPVAPAPKPDAPAAPVASTGPSTPPPPQSTPASPSAPASAPAPANGEAMTADQLNQALLTEFNRLGKNREPIDRVLREQFNVQSISALTPDQYPAVLAAVRAVQA